MLKRLLLAALAAAPFGAAAQCNPPTNLIITNVTSTSATLTFPVPSPTPVNYVIVYQTASGAAQTINPAPTAPPVALANLTPGTLYTVTVTSYCGTSGFSTAINASFTTGSAATCPSVTNLVLTRTSTSVSVSATATPGASGYFIDCATTTGTLVGSTAVTTPQYTFTGLSPNLAYRVCVSSICAGGGSPPVACASTPTALATRPAVEAAVSLAPNPASQQAVLTLPTELSRQGGEVLIRDLQRVVRRLPLPATARVGLDLSGLAPGLYVVQVQTPLGAVAKRLVVE
ncbi:fibronectin type III domain-containing protein [Hymenobacter sp. M29]|uniref:Fibronectin type III domain-containing protein n=1 Tax=Hymenobacter mellowenesis TaxID=3063995 RepID=A0ABT9ACL8_9BACT|nr:fibronectin type III domain-containing protein [Hymenobacter sp. M29]MDO7847099.1 fibronectin type III domain-containing protein [Hymenobacter sp. M29]